MRGKKGIIWGLWIILGIMGALVILAVMTIYVSSDYCWDRGYDTYNYDNIEEGYIQCCNQVIEDHIIQEKKDCEIFINTIWWLR